MRGIVFKQTSRGCTTTTISNTSTLLNSGLCGRNISSSGAPCGNAAATAQACESNILHQIRNIEKPRYNVREMINERKPGFPLSQEWYTSEEIFQTDMKYLWKKNWLFAGYTLQIKNPGEYFTYQVGNENVIVIRGDDMRIRAFFNTCRHRGSRLCTAEHGKVAKNITCPYHSWTYNKEGALIKASQMEDQIDFKEYGLIPCLVKSVGGLIFINLAKNPTYKFEPASEVFEHQLRIHNLDHAKIAHWKTDTIKANWKVVYENNRECYHCPNAHPEYIKANYDLNFSYVPLPNGTYTRVVDESHPRRDEVKQHIEECSVRWQKYGLECAPHNNFPGDGWYRGSRLPLRKGWVTESIDGKPVGPIMGKFDEADRDMGSMRIHSLPNYWLHLSGDHGVGTRLTPISPLQTRVDTVWIVNENAKEGVDYHLDKLLPFWDKTNASDWEICELNQAGILSDNYSPAPYSLKKESGVETYMKWYLNTLAKGINN